MAPQLQKKDDQLLNKLFYDEGLQVGIQKMYKYIQDNYPDHTISFRQVKDWLEHQEQYQRNKRTFQTRHVKPITASAPHQLLQMDLIDYSQNSAPNSYKYLISIIDVYSRYAWVYKSKNKKAETILRIFKKFYDDEIEPTEYPMKLLITDHGGEFVQLDPFLKEHGIKHITSIVPQNQSIVERFNQSFRRLLDRYTIIKQVSDKWSVINKVCSLYNSTYHTNLFDTPFKIYWADKPEDIALRNETQDVFGQDRMKKRIKVSGFAQNDRLLQKGDKVRLKITKKSKLEKHHGINNWSEHVFTIVRKLPTKIGLNDRYKIAKDNGSIIRQSFYRDDLQKIPE